MFNFLSMAENYETRKIGRYEDSNGYVSTCLVTDSDRPYETAISHEKFGNRTIVIATYDAKEEAKDGHDKCVEIYLNGLPETLEDVGESDIAQLCRIFGVNMKVDSKHET